MNMNEKRTQDLNVAAPAMVDTEANIVKRSRKNHSNIGQSHSGSAPMAASDGYAVEGHIE
jgi:hypothetical protein